MYFLKKNFPSGLEHHRVFLPGDLFYPAWVFAISLFWKDLIKWQDFHYWRIFWCCGEPYREPQVQFIGNLFHHCFCCICGVHFFSVPNYVHVKMTRLGCIVVTFYPTVFWNPQGWPLGNNTLGYLRVWQIELSWGEEWLEKYCTKR